MRVGGAWEHVLNAVLARCNQLHRRNECMRKGCGVGSLLAIAGDDRRGQLCLQCCDEQLREVREVGFFDFFNLLFRWDIALNIFERFAPLAGLITYNAAIGSCKQDGQWQRCLLLWQNLLAAWLQPVRWIEACRCRQRREARGLLPDVITYNCAIGSCQVAGEWVVALSLFNAMFSTSHQPDGSTYTELVGALDKAKQWMRALHIFSMASQQLQPDGTLTGSVAGAVSAAKGPTVAMSLLRKMLKRWQRSAIEGDDPVVMDVDVLERRPGVVVLYKPAGLSMEALMNKAFGMRWMAVVQTVSRRQKRKISYLICGGLTNSRRNKI